MNLHRRKLALNLAFYVFLAAWTLSCLQIIISNPTISLSDVFGFIERAEYLNASSLEPWVNGLYPFGYPLLLKGVTLLTRDYELSGKLISLVSGAASLVLVRLIGAILFSSVTGVIAAILCGLNPLFIHFSSTSGTDMVAATSVAASLLSIIAWENSLRRSKIILVISGLFLGLGYLFRYTSIAVLPFYILWILVWPGKSKNTIYLAELKLKQVCLLAGGFLIFAFPQLILSLFAKGNPFWNTQGVNVCFGVFGNGNWGQNMDACRDFKSAFGFIVQHPYQSTKNLVRNIFSIPSLSLLPGIIWPFSLSGALLSLWPEKNDLGRYSSRILLAGSLAAFCAAVSIAFVNNRLLLMPAIILSVYSAHGLLRIVPADIKSDNWRLPLRIFVFALILAVLLRGAVSRVLNPVSDYDNKRILASSVIEKALGKSRQKQEDVLSLSFDYYDLGSRLKTRYSLDWYGREGMGKFTSVQKIHSEMKFRGRSYLLYDNSAPFNVAGLKANWPLPEDELNKYFELVWRHEDARLLRAR